MKKRLTVFMHGGIGGGFFSQGQPNIASLVTALANDYLVTIFSQHPANDDFRPSSFKFITAPPFLKTGSLRWLWLVTCFFFSHLKNKTDVIYSFWAYPAGFWATLMGRFLSVPCVVHLQGGEVVGLPEISYGALLRPFSKRSVGWALRNATQLITLTNFQKEFALKIHHRDYRVIPFGVHQTQFEYSKKEKHQPVRCLHVGSLIPVKDQITLLRCFQLICQRQPAELQIVGEGYLEGELKNKCKDLGIEQWVRFSGFHKHSEMQEFYKWADILLHTSLYEGQCLAVTEAAASGVLIAGTNVGLISDLGEECCIIAKIGDYENLAQKINLLGDSPTEWFSKIENARKWTEANSFEKSYFQTKAIIDKCLDD